MLQQLQSHAVRIVMGVAFYLFGFFVVANALDLDDREIAVGLFAGFRSHFHPWPPRHSAAGHRDFPSRPW